MSILTGDELSFVEAQAIVEQQLDVVGNQPFAHPVHTVLQFLLNVLQAVDEGVSFPFREVQGFVHFIREERVFLDSASEVGAANQVGMKAQRIALRLERIAGGRKSGRSSFRLSEKSRKS